MALAENQSVGIQPNFGLWKDPSMPRSRSCFGTKRKPNCNSTTDLHSNDSDQFSAKRFCPWSNSNNLQDAPSNHEELLPGCLKDLPPLVSAASTCLPHHQPQAASHKFHASFISHIVPTFQTQPEDEVMEQDEESVTSRTDHLSSMDSDFVPDPQQYNPPSSPPSTPTTQKTFCAFSSCRGLKPSPTSGRFHCHCQASWRGMYGLDAGFYNDYY